MTLSRSVDPSSKSGTPELAYEFVQERAGGENAYCYVSVAKSSVQCGIQAGAASNATEAVTRRV